MNGEALGVRRDADDELQRHAVVRLAGDDAGARVRVARVRWRRAGREALVEAADVLIPRVRRLAGRPRGDGEKVRTALRLVDAEPAQEAVTEGETRRARQARGAAPLELVGAVVGPVRRGVRRADDTPRALLAGRRLDRRAAEVDRLCGVEGVGRVDGDVGVATRRLVVGSAVAVLVDVVARDVEGAGVLGGSQSLQSPAAKE